MIKSFTGWLAIAAMLLGTSLSFPSHAGCGDKPGPKVDWSKCTKMKLVLRNDVLTGGVFYHADLSLTDLAGANLVEANLVGAILYRARLRDADLTGSDLTKAEGSRADFENATLTDAILTKSELLRANFSGAVLINAILSKAELGRAVFADANLTGVDLSYSNIARADFTNAELEHADFLRAYTFLTRVEGVDLSQAIGLTQEQLELACGDDKTRLPAGLEKPTSWPCAHED